MESDDKWDYNYSVNSWLSESQPVSVQRKVDGKIFSTGHFVLLESSNESPYIGFIRGFSRGENGLMEVKTLRCIRAMDLPESMRSDDATKVCYTELRLRRVLMEYRERFT